MAARSEVLRGLRRAINSRRHAQPHMFVLHRLRRRHQPHPPRRENGLPVLHPKRFQQKQRLVKLGGDFAEWQLSIELQLGFKIGGSEPGARVAIEMLAQLLDICARQREADRVRMSAVAGKQFVARLNRVQQMKCRDRSSRSAYPSSPHRVA